MAFDYKKELAKAKIETDRMIAIERERWLRERTALEMEQKRQRETQAAILKEQQRQADLLRKHEEEIEKLKYEVSVARNERESLRARMENLEDLYEMVSEELRRADESGNIAKKKKALREIMVLDNQMAQVEKRMAKANYTIAKAERKTA